MGGEQRNICYGSDETNIQMSLEDVEKLMDETEEAIAYQNEISAALSGHLTVEDEVDKTVTEFLLMTCADVAQIGTG